MKNKRIISIFMAVVCLFSSFTFVAYAIVPNNDEIQASGLIYQFNLAAAKESSTKLYIEGFTDCDPVVVKCGFKNLKVQRRANSSSSWSDFYNYGNVYEDTDYAIISRTITVDPGYQYRVTCKHYAKKNILNTQTISNTSNIVTF